MDKHRLSHENCQMSDNPTVPRELKHMEKSLCLHQWDFPCANLSSGKVRSCCRIYPRTLEESAMATLGKEAIFNDQHNKDRRLDMLAGRQHEECNVCWDLEAKGAPSPRLGLPVFLENMQKRLKVTQDELVRMMLDPEKHPQILEAHHPFELEISFGNRCDLACVYCSYMYSSRIATEDMEAGLLDRKAYELEMRATKPEFKRVFWDWFAADGYRTLEVVTVIGGEPLINDLLYENIDQLITICRNTDIQRSKKILIQIITNLNAPPAYLKKFLSKLPELSRFFDISLLASMEATGERAEYIRHGLSWDRFVANCDEVIETSREFLYQFGFLSSVNIFSVPALADFVRFALEMKKKHDWPVYLSYNQVMHPQALSVLNLDSTFVTYIDRALEVLAQEKGPLPESWEEYRLNLLKLKASFEETVPDPEAIEKFRSWIRNNDGKRNRRKFSDVFPEFEAFFRRVEVHQEYVRKKIVRSEKGRASALTLPVRTFAPDPEFTEWYESTGKLAQVLRIDSPDVSLEERFFPFLEYLRNTQHTRRQILEMQVSVSGSEGEFRDFLHGLSRLRGKPFRPRLRILLENAGDRGPYFATGVSWDFWKRRVAQIRDVFPEVEIVLLPRLTVLAVPFLKKMVLDLVELRDSLGVAVAFGVHPEKPPAYLDPAILGPEFHSVYADVISLLQAEGIPSPGVADELNSFRQKKMELSYLVSLRREFFLWVSQKDSGRGTEFLRLYSEFTEFYRKTRLEIFKQRILSDDF